jgi:hypothetical protein
MREHNFMGEQRDPFDGVNAVGIHAPDEFIRPLDGQPDELGVTELPDDLQRQRWGTRFSSFISHHLTEGGHWWSMLKFPHIIFEDRKTTKSWIWH